MEVNIPLPVDGHLHFLTATFSKGRSIIYVDGKRVTPILPEIRTGE